MCLDEEKKRFGHSGFGINKGYLFNLEFLYTMDLSSGLILPFVACVTLDK